MTNLLSKAATSTRFHLALRVRDLEASIAFYQKLFQMEPTKIRPGYAKFEVPDPSLNFTLNQANTNELGQGSLSHIGIQLSDAETLRKTHETFSALGLVKHVETATQCCYALQDKFWLKDPDGNSIEFFQVLQDDSVTQPQQPATTRDGAATHDACCA